MNCREAAAAAVRYGRQHTGEGRTADYIEALAGKDPSRLGAAVCSLGGDLVTAGDSEDRFTMQSIGKLVLLIAAIEQNGPETVFSKVGMEPSGDAFNSMVRLDLLAGSRPSNPMINAGAIAMASCIRGSSAGERTERCLTLARRLTADPKLDIDREVYESERQTGYKNRAIINLLRSNRIVDGDLESHLDLYFSACSIRTDCIGLARFAAVLAGNGVSPVTGETLVPLQVVKLIRSLMVTCGMYDYSGRFAATVGIPSKSGVGGGILSASIGRMGIGVYGPALESHGASVGGLRVLEYLSDRLGLNMF